LENNSTFFGKFSVHRQDFFTVHTARVYVIKFWWQLGSRISTSWLRSQAVSKKLFRIPLPCVQWKTPDHGQGTDW